MQPDTFYLCFRPDTKSKEKNARCRQYPFDTTAELVKWIQARRSSTERVIVEVIVRGKLRWKFVDTRAAFANSKRVWPLP